MKSFDTELISGSVVRSVWKLAWPAVMLRLVDGLHSLVDHILVGQFVGHHGNAAIGAAWLLFLVVVLFLVSLFQGMVVLAARYAGMQDRDNLSKVVYHTFLATVYLLLFVVVPVGYLIAPFILNLVNITPEVYGHALPYLRIMFTCSLPLFLMFMLASAFQASGDVKTPLKLGMLSTTINIIVSATLIIGIGPFPALGVSGAAFGTALAPIASVGIALFLIYKRKVIIRPPRHYTLIPDLALVKSITRVGVPTGLQAILLNLGGLLLFRKLGVLEHSAAAQAAYTICYNQLFSLVTWASFGLRVASATLMGQNLGAGKRDRGRHSVYIVAGMGAVYAVALGVVFWFFPYPLMLLFDAVDGHVYEFGVSLLRYTALSGIFLTSTLALTGGLQGAGDTKTPMYIAFVTQIGVLVGLAELFDFLGVLSAELAWLAILLSHLSRWVLTQTFFSWGKWEKSLAELHRA